MKIVIPGKRVSLAIAKKRSRKWQYDFIEETIRKDATHTGRLVSVDGKRACILGGLALRLGWQPESYTDERGYDIVMSLPVIGRSRGADLYCTNDNYFATPRRRRALLALVREWRTEEGV